MAIIEKEPCYIFHQREYKEHSLILDVLSLNYGHIAIFAQGIKKPNSPLKSCLQVFSPLKLSLSRGKGELHYITDYEVCGETYNFQPPFVFCATYLNELLHYLYKVKDADRALFINYVACLEAINKREDIELCLRYFELQLLKSLGYGLIPQDIDGNILEDQACYQFSFGNGFVKVKANSSINQYIDHNQRSLSIAQSNTSSASAVSNIDDEDDGLMFSKKKVKGPKLQSNYLYSSCINQNVFSNLILQEDLVGSPLAGGILKDILSKTFAKKESLSSAKLLINSIFQKLLNGQEIKSRQLFREYMQIQKLK